MDSHATLYVFLRQAIESHQRGPQNGTVNLDAASIVKRSKARCFDSDCVLVWDQFNLYAFHCFISWGIVKLVLHFLPLQLSQVNDITAAPPQAESTQAYAERTA